MSFTVRRRKLLAWAKHRATVLEAVASLFQILDAPIRGNYPSDFFSNSFGVLKGELVCPLWPNLPSNLQENFPDYASLFNAWSRSFGTENYSPFCAGLGDPAGNFVSSRGREQYHRVVRIDQHL